MERSHSDLVEMEAVLSRAIALVETAHEQLEQHLERMTRKEALALLRRASRLRYLARQAARLSEDSQERAPGQVYRSALRLYQAGRKKGRHNGR